MPREILVAPSLLTADFLELSRAIDLVNSSPADWFHLDVMDGRFVPNISFGMAIIARIKTRAVKPLDVHLMIEEPGRYAEAFRQSGADHLTVHYEACPNLHRNLEQIRGLGMKAGVALNPHTPVSLLRDILYLTDIVNLMSVNPGFGAQSFIPHTLDKIRELSAMIHTAQSSTLIEIDGGVTLENAHSIIGAGASVLVAGNTVFSAADPAATILKLKQD